MREFYAAVMYVSVSRLRIDPSSAPRLVEAFRGRAGLVDAFPGFVRLEVWQSDREVGEILMVSHWESREFFKQYMKSADHRVSHERIDSGLLEEITLERLEHLQSYEVVGT